MKRFTKGRLSCNLENQKWSQCPALIFWIGTGHWRGALVLTFPSQARISAYAGPWRALKRATLYKGTLAGEEGSVFVSSSGQAPSDSVAQPQSPHCQDTQAERSWSKRG